MKILVSGSNSQIALDLKKRLNSNEFKLFFFNKSELNILNIKSYQEIFNRIKPNIFINTSAYTNVSESENNKNEAYTLNAFCLKDLSIFCNKYNCLFIHFSTDYVFDGYKKNVFYSEDDFTNPKTIYGLSKLEGEKIIKKYFENFLIIRISWLYSAFKNNFLKFVINQVKNKKETIMIDDSFSIPTSALTITSVIKKILQISNYDIINNQILHLCDEGEALSPYEYSKYIFNFLNNKGFDIPNLINIKNKDFPTNIERPIYSPLNNNKIKKILNLNLNTWKKNTHKTIEDIFN